MLYYSIQRQKGAETIMPKHLDREEAQEQLQSGTIKVRTEIGGGDSVVIPLREERRRNSRI